MIKKFSFFIFILLALINLCHAKFYLNPSTEKGFNKSEINIHIASTDCSDAGFSTAKFKDMVEDAVEDYWNSVPTSSLKLKVKSIGTIDIGGDSHAQAIEKVPSNSILAGCNASANGFSNAGEPSTTLGSASMTCDGSKCQAVLILNAHTDGQLTEMSRSEIEAVIAHEIGHAFGLGHSNRIESLMYYSVGGKYQKWLGIDDIDGATYLYPHEQKDPLGVLGNCGSITPPKGGSAQFTLSFFIGLMLVSLGIKTKS